MNENTEFYEFKGKHGYTKCKGKILDNTAVIAYECNAKHCKFILCPKCQKEMISTIVSPNRNKFTNYTSTNEVKRTSGRSSKIVNYNK